MKSVVILIKYTVLAELPGSARDSRSILIQIVQIVYKQSPSERNLQIIRAAKSKVQQTARRCANEYWTQLSQDIQTAAISGNIRGMDDGIKKTLVPTQSKTAFSNLLVQR